MFTTAHYAAISTLIHDELKELEPLKIPKETDEYTTREAQTYCIVERLADMFEADNKLFNRDLFIAACGLEK